jgi:hypothetical protein
LQARKHRVEARHDERLEFDNGSGALEHGVRVQVPLAVLVANADGGEVLAVLTEIVICASRSLSHDHERAH